MSSFVVVVNPRVFFKMRLRESSILKLFETYKFFMCLHSECQNQSSFVKTLHRFIIIGRFSIFKLRSSSELTVNNASYLKSHMP